MATTHDWPIKRLDEFVSLQRGRDLTWRDRRPGKVPVLGSAGVNGAHDQAIAPGPGVVLGRSGASFGQAHYVDTDFWPHNTALYVTDFHGNHPRFAFHLLDSLDFSRHNSGGAQQSLNRNFIAGIDISVPDLSEQQRIAAVIDDRDRLIATLQRLIAKKQVIKQGMMQQLLTGRTRLPGFAETWTDTQLGDHVTFVKTVALSRAQLDGSSPLRYLHYGDIHTRNTVYLDASQEPMPRAATVLAGRAGKLQVGDLVFADASEDPEGVGKSVEITGVPSEGVVPGLHTIAARFDKAVLADGFKAYLQFIPACREQLLRLAAGTKVLATTRTYVSSVTLALPGIDEQKAIARALSDCETEIEALRVRLDKARAIKTGMMQQLLTGRTRLPVEVSS
ncbi:restriction endonuclease subunit S [Gordonia polyisoprenivorans]|uniref:restriction endonuclease subunit S n=1 Tax=Gordonia polyisoprenivorans TaxID=84595 RepID=UPI002234BC31|nr:restriction endonuclease subunit S [Gordonia polyisoprenivorans]